MEPEIAFREVIADVVGTSGGEIQWPLHGWVGG